jgi:hypothetical protein
MLEVRHGRLRVHDDAKNLKTIFERVRGAGTPPKFTLEFLKALGHGSSSDRPVIGVLKGLGFLTADGVPTERYNDYRNAGKSGHALAAGLRDGWAPVFLADQRAHEKNTTQLTELFKSVSGKGEAVARKMATTFKTLCEMATWTEAPATGPAASPLAASEGEEALVDPPAAKVVSASGGRLTLHHDVHVHLPATSDVSVYTAIFRALKAELLD